MPFCRLLAWLLLIVAAFFYSLPGWAEEATPAAAKEVGEEVKEKDASAGEAASKDEDDDTKFIRLRRDDAGKPVALETAIVRYVPADGSKNLEVDLIGAVHVGDKAYYDKLNERFTGYDVLLYELVAPPGAKIPKGGRGGNSSGHPIGAMQDGMKSVLDLEHQLDQIDYTAENFVHADMSPDEFSKTMADRGESFMQMFFRMMGQGAAQQAHGQSNDLGMFLALFSKNRATRMKIAMAEQFENLDGQMAAFDGPDGSTIITERNKKAFEVLDKQIKDGKTKIGVFYGAGHLADMEKRLLNDFKLKRAGDEEWVEAWSLRTEKPARSKRKAAEKQEEAAPEPAEAK